MSLVECRRCFIAWQYPYVRSEDESVQHSKSRYERASQHAYYDPESRRRVASRQCEYLKELRGTAGSLLDVGAGDGAFVSCAASMGWHATGVDPAATPLEFENGRLIAGFLEDVPASLLFDVVTLFDVIEHVPNPQEVLVEAYARVRPGGHLVVETGNYQSGDRVQEGRRWWAYAWDHRWYFGPPALERMLQSLGAIDYKLAPCVLRPGWQGHPTYAPWLGGHVRNVLKNPLSLPREFSSYLEQCRVARRWPNWSGLSIFTVSARKPAA